jgi:beta-lactam-binding protein with PASTA domain
MHYDHLPQYEGLEIIVQSRVYSDEYPSGCIIDQRPDANTTVEPGRKVFVVISLGPKPPDVTMPDLVGMSKAEALAALSGLNLDLDVTVEEEYDDTVATGRVISTNVRKHTMLYRGQKIVLTVSKGKETVTAAMLDLVGQSKVDAERRLALRGFTNIIWVPVECKQPEGTVVSQSVQEGEEVDISAPITLEYSNGIAPPVTLDYTFTDLPLMEESYTLTIMQGDQIIVQAQTIEPGQTTFVLTLTGREPTEYTIYINWDYYATVTVIFE